MKSKILNELILKDNNIIFFEIQGVKNNIKCAYYKINADIKRIENYIIKEIENNLNNGKTIEEFIIPSLSKIDENEIEECLYTGELIINYKSSYYKIPTSNTPKRNPETPPSELTIVGSKDGFIEDINTNISLLRKRIKSSSLKTEFYEIGNINPTKVVLTYVDYAIDEDILNEVKNKLQSINVDYLYNAGHLQSLLNDKKLTIFPSLNYTSRADFCYESLLSGRFAIFIDNVPIALIAPINFAFFTDYTDASNEHYLVALFDRIIQYIALFIGIFFLGFVTALLTYHTEFIPYLFLADFISARKGVSVSIVTELFLTDLFFQIFRIAGTKSLSIINQALLIMGSIIISQIAVSSGIVSQEIILFTAHTTIAPFLVSNNIAFNNSINILKMIIFISSALFGFLGFCISSIIIVLYLANQESFGVSFGNMFQIFNPFSFKINFLSKAFNKKNVTVKNVNKENKK